MNGIEVIFVKTTLPLAASKSLKTYFLNKTYSQGHKVIDLGVHCQRLFSGVCLPNMTSLSLILQKLSQRLKFTLENCSYIVFVAYTALRNNLNLC